MNYEKSKFRYGVPVVIAFFVAIGIRILIYARSSGFEGADPVGPAVRLGASALFLFFVSVVLGWVAFYVSRRRHLVATIVVSGVSVIYAAIGLVDLQNVNRAVENRDVLTDYLSQGIADVEEQTAKVERGDVLDFTESNEMSQLAASLREAASKSTGQQRQILLVFAEVNEAMAPLEREYDETLAVMLDAGSWDAKHVEETSEIDHRREITSRFESANAAWMESKKGVPERAEKNLIEAGFSVKDARVATLAAREIRKANVAVHLLDQEFVDLLYEMYDFYLERWGYWGYDSDVDFIGFTTDEDVNRFNVFISRLNSIAERTKAAQLELLTVRQRLQSRAME